ncbi:MAG TPA: hypothetical protein ENK18_22985 [Deltaproteobacteria bacterium]|nr:hypothetical protein [Deltaproteobacteria bacterium]
MARPSTAALFTVILLAASCDGGDTTPTDKTGETSPTDTGPTDTGPTDTGPTGTGTTDTGPDLTCAGDEWLAGGFWDFDASFSGPSMLATSLSLDALGAPVLLLNQLGPGNAPSSLTLRWREPTDPDGELPRIFDWAGLPPGTGTGTGTGAGTGAGWLPLGRVLEETSEGSLVGGQLHDGTRTIPFAARIDRSAGSIEPWILDPDVASGSVTAGPVFTAEGSWWLGEITEPGGVSEIVVWRIDAGDVVSEELRYTSLSTPGSGEMVPGALAVADDGRVLVGGGARSPVVAEQGAFLLAGGVGGFTELLAMPSSETSGVPGAILAAGSRADRLAYVWGGLADPADPADPSWRLYDGTLSDPASATLADEDTTGETAAPMALSLHPSGAVFASGGWVRADGKPPAPYVRMGVDGSYTTTFAAPGPNPGWINVVDITDDGLPWALCVYSSDGVATDEIVILEMVCLL